MKNLEFKKLLFIVILACFMVLVVYLVTEYFVRCKKDGKTNEQAIEIVTKYLPIHFKGKFLLKEQYFDTKEKEWLFTYRQVESTCEVDIIIDRCGAFHSGGMSEECEPLP